MSRKTLLKKEKGLTSNKLLLKAKIAIFLKRGLDINQVAKMLNISDSMMGQLRTDPDFECLVEKSQVECESDHLKNIEEAGKMGAWQASAWYLERKFPDRYGKKDTIKHEYQLKVDNFKLLIASIINELPVSMRKTIIQKLRTANIESQVSQFALLPQNDKSGLPDSIEDIIDITPTSKVINFKSAENGA